MIPVIHDGDHGSDDFVATLAILSHAEKYDLIGVTTCGGNVDARTAARNASIACAVAGKKNIQVHAGSNQSFNGRPFPGDGAHGVDGIGGARFTIPVKAPASHDAVGWLEATLTSSHEKILLFATGPLTNLAFLLKRNPHLAKKILRIIIMGGAFGNPGGNITLHAEFNFMMDPDAAAYVLSINDLERTILPLDATQSISFDPDMQATFARNTSVPHRKQLTQMLREAEKYDMPRFGSAGSFVHDPQTVFFSLYPEYYETIRASVLVDITNSPSYGQSTIKQQGPISEIAIRCVDTSAVRAELYKAISFALH